jgi:hypothetical protein
MSVETQVSFESFSIVACGTLSLELNHLRRAGFLNARRILYTKPGRHEAPKELEALLVRQIRRAKEASEKIIVVYGGKFCYINTSHPGRTIDHIIREEGSHIGRLRATHCVDMLADSEERKRMAGDRKVFWLTPGWITHRTYVFQDWDEGQANENFPQHTGGAILLDAVGFWDDYCERHPERVLDFSDWMAIPIEPHAVSLDRLKGLLAQCATDVDQAAHEGAGSSDRRRS